MGFSTQHKHPYTTYTHFNSLSTTIQNKLVLGGCIIMCLTGMQCNAHDDMIQILVTVTSGMLQRARLSAPSSPQPSAPLRSLPRTAEPRPPLPHDLPPLPRVSTSSGEPASPSTFPSPFPPSPRLRFHSWCAQRNRRSRREPLHGVPANLVRPRPLLPPR